MKISNKAILLLGLVLLASAFGQSQSPPKQVDKTGEGKPEGKPEGGKPEEGKPEGRKTWGRKLEPLMCHSEAKIADPSRLWCCKCPEDIYTTTGGNAYACKQKPSTEEMKEEWKKTRKITKAMKEKLKAKKEAMVEFMKTLKEKKCCEQSKEDKKPILCSLKGEKTPPVIKCNGQTEEGSLKCYPSFLFGKMRATARLVKKITTTIRRKNGKGAKQFGKRMGKGLKKIANNKFIKKTVKNEIENAKNGKGAKVQKVAENMLNRFGKKKSLKEAVKNRIAKAKKQVVRNGLLATGKNMIEKGKKKGRAFFQRARKWLGARRS